MIVEVTCSQCGKVFPVEVNKEKFLRWRNSKEPIQHVFPELTPNERELLISQVCEECFDKMFEEEE